MDINTFKKLFSTPAAGPYALLDSGFPQWIKNTPLSDEAITAHLSGDAPLCLNPVGYEGTCKWAALDIDAKGDAPPVNIPLLQKKCEEHNIPLSLVPSRSGKGAHAYLFLREEAPANQVRATLDIYAQVLGWCLGPGNHIEIFPKQDKVEEGGCGNCIRPPLDLDSPSPAYFIPLPPCIMQPPQEGERNNYYYNLTLWAAYSGIERCRPFIKSINSLAPAPLPSAEITKTIRSAQRQYKRNKENIGGLGFGCSTCPSTRKDKCRFLVQKVAAEMRDNFEMVIFRYISRDDVVRMYFINAPHPKPKYVDKKGAYLDFSVEEVYSIDKVATTAVTTHGVMVPRLKPAKWKALVDEVLLDAERRDVDSALDVGHYIISRLRAMGNKIQDGLDKFGKGYPCRGEDGYTYVRLHDFIRHLRKESPEIGVTDEQVAATLAYFGEEAMVNGYPCYRLSSTQMEGAVPYVFDPNPEELTFKQDESGDLQAYDRKGDKVIIPDAVYNPNSDRYSPAMVDKLKEATAQQAKDSFNPGF